MPDQPIDIGKEMPENEALWAELGETPRSEAPASLRRDFYRRLRERSERSTRWAWLEWLRPLAPAAIALVIGIGIGRVDFGPETTADAPVVAAEIASLRGEVTALSRQFALARLKDDNASTRLDGIAQLASLAVEDDEIAGGLLEAATSDPVASVRGAALDALGPRLRDPTVGRRIADLLLETPSVLVQLSVADLIMRWGDDNMIEDLVDAAETRQLYPDVSRFVLERVRRKTV
ncbi:MAG: hypothetical protein AAGE01_05580 [Pseudomonadota bacterium]